MAARLILNADDFGLTPGINHTIEQLHRAGVLTSATLMATGPAFEDAVRIAQRNPHLGIGCHVILLDGTPASLPSSIPSLLGPDRRSLRPSLPAFALAATLGRLRSADICTEALAQIRRLQVAGIQVTHLDTHKHTHMFPAVLRPLLQAAMQAGVPAIRHPFEPSWSRVPARSTPLRRLQVQALATLFQRSFLTMLRSSGLRTTEGTIGIAATGHLDATALRSLFRALPSTGYWELVCHPGQSDADLNRISTRLRTQREIERDALLSVLPQELAQPGAPSLIHFGELPGLSTQSLTLSPAL